MRNVIFNKNVLQVLVLIFGLLYIPVFIYGYFWLWIFPFTMIITLFVRAMIDSAIEKVKSVGHEAAQAKAMIPIFIKMNVVATAAFSLPFLSALMLNHYGYIQGAYFGGLDYAFVEWCLGLWAKKYTLISMMSVAQEVPGVQIMLSNMCLIMIAIIALLLACWKKYINLFVIMFHQESYIFLQRPPTRGDISSLIGIVIQVVIMIGIFGVEALTYTSVSDLALLFYMIFINLLTMAQLANIVSAFVEYKVRKKVSVYVKEHTKGS